ncbi:MAG TPA: metalloregulator ArsR/SmtB family transcription factor [Desulfuromonadaceae bacterium]
MNEFANESAVFRVLSEPVRLQILGILSCGELCACNILENLAISQPTLSYHMKALISSGLVIAEKRATWMYYSINYPQVEKLHRDIDRLTVPKDDCICKIIQSECVSSDETTADADMSRMFSTPDTH